MILIQVSHIEPNPENVDPTWIPEETGGVSNISITEEPAFNVTEHRGGIWKYWLLTEHSTNCFSSGFLHGFVESLSVILVSEIGDKTFFIAAILAMSNNKLTVGKRKDPRRIPHR